MNVREVLEELYEWDPGLKNQEARLMDIIEKMTESKPPAEPDPEFRARLRKELLEKMTEEKKQSRKFLPFSRPALLRAAGLCAAALALVVGIRVFQPGTSSPYESAPAVAESTPQARTEARGEATADFDAAAPTASPGAAATAGQDTAPAPLSRKESEPPRPAPASPVADGAEAVGTLTVPAPPAAPAERALAESETYPSGAAKSASADNFYGSQTLNLQRDQPFPEVSRIAEDLVMDEEAAVSGETFSNEEYQRIDENRFFLTREEPLSTFSIDVDTASYANVRRFLSRGSLPYPDAVRIEELVNYFTYDYPRPEGDDPFSFTTELARCPWNQEHQLLLVGLQGRSVDLRDVPPANLVFLLDVSGSMGVENKLPLLKEALGLLVDTLNQDDRIAIVAYAGAAGLVLPPTPGNNREAILAAMDNLEAGGSTAGGAGIELAYRTALENLRPGGNNRVILATDGDFNVGASSQGELTRLIEEKRDLGIYLTVLGLGMGNYKDSTMESLADRGNGNYAYIDTLNEARKVLVDQQQSTLFTIAEDVKIQIEFNPLKVESYRLLGYENRILAAADFSDDTKDAGEIGAGHSVTALYEIIPAGPEAASDESSALRYQTSRINEEIAGSGELGFIQFRYKNPGEDQSRLISSPIPGNPTPFGKASSNLQFAATVAEWGSLLRGSEYGDKDPLERLMATAGANLGEDRFGYRREFLELLVKTDEILTARGGRENPAR